MSEHSKLATESMMQLTERVMKADMAQRKRKMIAEFASKSSRVLWLPLLAYVIYHTIHIKSRSRSVNNQAGDPFNIYKQFMGKNYMPMRQIFRPGMIFILIYRGVFSK